MDSPCVKYIETDHFRVSLIAFMAANSALRSFFLSRFDAMSFSMDSRANLHNLSCVEVRK